MLAGLDQVYEDTLEALRVQLVTERQTRLALEQDYDEECSFPLGEAALRLEAVQSLKVAGHLPPQWREK